MFVLGCGLAQQRGDSGAVSQQRDVARIIAAVGQSARARYGFACELERVAAAAPVALAEGFEFLEPYLDGSRAGPLVTCVGAVDGLRWVVSIDRPDLQRGRTDHYYDGANGASLRHRQRVAGVREYDDPGVGVAPWLATHVGVESLHAALTAAHATGRLRVTPRSPEVPEDAGSWRLYRLTLLAPNPGMQVELDCKVGSEVVYVRQLELRRAGKRISRVELGGFEQVAGCALPTRVVVHGTFEQEPDEDGTRRGVASHWRIRYGDQGPDPAGVLQAAGNARELRSKNAYRTEASIDAELVEVVAAARAGLRELSPPVAPPPALVPLAQMKWPSVADWHERLLAAPTTMLRREAVLHHSTRAAVVACAQLQGQSTTFAALRAQGDDTALDSAGAVQALAGLGLEYCVLELDPRQRARLRDPFLHVRRPGKAGADAIVFTDGRESCAAWSLREGMRAGTSALPVDRATFVVSARDRDRLER